MITFLGALLGFVGSMVPECLNFIKQRADRAHELRIMQLQLTQKEQGKDDRLEEIRLVHDAAQIKSLYSTYRTDIRWVDALNGTVRPVIAYSFFLLYATVKLMQFSYIDPTNIPMPWQIWGEEDQAIFAAIMSFYYGQRAFTKARH